MRDKIQSKEANNLILKRLLITAILIVVVFGVANYVTNEEMRTYINRNILKKEIVENNIKSIEINSEDNLNVYAYSKYISVFAKNELKLYDSSANNLKTLNIEISRPIIDSEDKYLVIAEDNGKSIYLIKDVNILWKNEIDGKIVSSCVCVIIPNLCV